MNKQSTSPSSSKMKNPKKNKPRLWPGDIVRFIPSVTRNGNRGVYLERLKGDSYVGGTVPINAEFIIVGVMQKADKRNILNCDMTEEHRQSALAENWYWGFEASSCLIYALNESLVSVLFRSVL